MRFLIAIGGVVVLAAIAAMATVAGAGPLPPPAVERTPAPIDWPAARPTEAPQPAHLRLLGGFILPLGAGDVPADAAYLPNSPREYRAGYHEGIDFPAAAGTPVHAAKAGTVLRVDTGYREWTNDERQAAFDAAQTLGFTPAATLDRIRGRQVWIDHGEGIVTRYAHLSAVAPLHVGDPVTQGEVIGAVGSSGFPEGGPHLHFEIRVGDDFYGDGLPLAQLRYAIRAAFR